MKVSSRARHLVVGSLVAWALAAGSLHRSSALADEIPEPGDPVASIDGQPIYFGEINLILFDQLGADKLDRATTEIRRAAAVILVRRHLAMITLRDKGGTTLQQMIDKDFADFRTELRRQGSSIEAYAKRRTADERCLSADFAWRTAWRTYLKSRMTNENLRQYFQRERKRYDGGRWNVSQIFVSVDVNDSVSLASSVESMNRLAEELRTADSVENRFEASAREYSDAGSAEQGGRIGWIQSQGDLPKPVMRAIEKLDVGEISDAIRSPLGIHLLLLNDYEPGTLTFDEMTDQSQLRRDAADALFLSLISEQKDANVDWHMNQFRPPMILP